MFLAWPVLLAFVVYLLIAHPADLGPITLAVQSGGWVAIFGHLTRVLIRERPLSAARLARVISEGCLLLCITIGLVIDGAGELGWTHGSSRDALAGVGVTILLATAAYWLIGGRRLKAVLERRAVDR